MRCENINGCDSFFTSHINAAIPSYSYFVGRSSVCAFFRSFVCFSVRVAFARGRILHFKQEKNMLGDRNHWRKIPQK